jgi:hypothetical protein
MIAGSSGWSIRRATSRPILPDIEAGIGERQIRRFRRMLRDEFREQRCDPATAKVHRSPRDPNGMIRFGRNR